MTVAQKEGIVFTQTLSFSHSHFLCFRDAEIMRQKQQKALDLKQQQQQKK